MNLLKLKSDSNNSRGFFVEDWYCKNRLASKPLVYANMIPQFAKLFWNVSCQIFHMWLVILKRYEACLNQKAELPHSEIKSFFYFNRNMIQNKLANDLNLFSLPLIDYIIKLWFLTKFILRVEFVGLVSVISLCAVSI